MALGFFMEFSMSYHHYAVRMGGRAALVGLLALLTACGKAEPAGNQTDGQPSFTAPVEASLSPQELALRGLACNVTLRSANNPAMVACWLAATKAGAVVVNTMPMLRAGELTQIVDKAEITHALCDTRLMEELVACAKGSKHLATVVGFDGTANHDAELDRVALSKSVKFQAVPTGRDDVALLGFTSGTTGEPKATMHQKWASGNG